MSGNINLEPGSPVSSLRLINPRAAGHDAFAGSVAGLPVQKPLWIRLVIPEHAHAESHGVLACSAVKFRVAF